MAPQGVDATLNAIIQCIDQALIEDGAPTCSTGTTIGNPAIANCCECASGTTGELWGSLVRVYQGDQTTGSDVRSRRPCAPQPWFAQYRITLARCFPTLDERGELPDAEDQGMAASELHADVATIYRAVNCCDTLDDVPMVEQATVTTDPSGGCSILTALVRAPISVSSKRNPRPGA